MKLVITESQSDKLSENVRDWVKNKISPTVNKGTDLAMKKASDIAQDRAVDKMKGTNISPESMEYFKDINIEKNAPTISKAMAKIAALKKSVLNGDETMKNTPTTSSLPAGEIIKTSPSGEITHTVPSGKIKVIKAKKVKVPKNLSIKDLGMYMMHPLGAKAKITSKYGVRPDPINGKKTKHNGVDISAISGSLVYSPLDGVVTRSEDTSATNPCGGHIRINHGTVQTKYCHLSNLLVTKDEKVKRGQIIGRTGGGKDDPMQGKSTGAHLHYEIRDENDVAQDPLLIEPNLV